MWYYLLVPLAAVAVNMIPVFAPPTWTVLVGLLLTFDLNPWAVAVLGVIGATIGRFLLGLYAPWAARCLLHEQANQNLAYLGGKLNGRARSTMLFIFLYSLTPSRPPRCLRRRPSPARGRCCCCPHFSWPS